jgi:excisionase family DNA binding protein
MKKSNHNHNFLTPNQAAQYLNVSLSTLKKFIYVGKIKSLKTPGGHHRIRRRDLVKMEG